MTTKSITLLLCALALASMSQSAQAGCPFDDGSCQEYCNQQGCNLGYCGHFAWIQCICRKCGDEWNWYDKVHYNPDKQVNQTELDSLKLNGSAPLILTSNQAKRPQEATVASVSSQAAPLQPRSLAGQQQQQPQQKQQASTPPAIATTAATVRQPEQQKVAATLTTLLIPDLSDGSRLDLNDIPDENSEKFLDYLTKNHEKLVQATNQGPSSSSASSSSSSARSSSQDGDSETKDDDESESGNTGASDDNSDADSQAEETVEIQISSSNNNQAQQQQQQQPLADKPARPASSSPSSAVTGEPSGDNERSSSTMRLLRMAVIGRSPDDIFLP